ncbi:MAG: DNA-directed RNA polymerase II core subunit [Phylliscum demangeonii]|nr:MAG: DNA-directed RNA polymerase II core subunit [Phylliscum demangeonii]
MSERMVHRAYSYPGTYPGITSRRVRGGSVPGPDPELYSPDNIPDRFESYMLMPGESKVKMTIDTRVSSAATFTFLKEDHTLGEMLTSSLNKHNGVRFAACKIPHPLEFVLEVRVETDGNITPKEAVVHACTKLIDDLGTLSRAYTRESELYRIARIDQPNRPLPPPRQRLRPGQSQTEAPTPER